MNVKKNKGFYEDELYDYKEIVGEENKPLNSLSRTLKKQLNKEREKSKEVYEWE